MQRCQSRTILRAALYHQTRFPVSIGMQMARPDYQCSTHSLGAIWCIHGAVGSFNHGLNITLRCLYRSQPMSEYLFSRVIPREDLGWSQVEKFTRLDPYGQHQAVWHLFDLPADTARTGTAFLFR